MPSKKDPGYPAQIEAAIKKRWGEEAVRHPLALWDEEKEKEYSQQIKKEQEREQKKESQQMVEREGFCMPFKLINKNSNRICTVCEEYSFSVQDDLYMNKFNCCFKCYTKYSDNMSGRNLLDEIQKNKRKEQNK